MRTGQPFEIRVYEAIKKALSEGKLGLRPEFCRIFHQKGYYSKDRKRKIRTDISIELCLKEGSGPTIVWVWECKDHSRRISVGEVEEFHAKLEQIGADMTKGTIICSTNGFQSSAWTFAESKGIGLARFLPTEEEIEHDLESQGPFALLMLIIGLVLILAIVVRNVVDFLRRRNGRSWSEYKYQQAYSELRDAHCDPTFVLEPGDFYGLSTCMIGSKHRERITRKIGSYVEVEINYIQAMVDSTAFRESPSVQDRVSRTVLPF